ncbi:hypothetical protein PanWU01x14_354960 [Parasponia andersonii]|uniref:Uncharacterized protein n=1 Tax=Parasponia andersonii TaxID=3476 RepID=A0A2P5A9F2_PARAD|nr:hypothetical protein PanWU01x14_354960 [Parasponia andersonii]
MSVPQLNSVNVSLEALPKEYDQPEFHLVKVQVYFSEGPLADHTCHRMYKWKIKCLLNTDISRFNLGIYKTFIEGAFNQALRNRTAEGHLYWVSLAMNVFACDTFFIERDLLGFDHVLSIRFAPTI